MKKSGLQKEKQPLLKSTFGSVFKNHYQKAGQLIEGSG